MYPQELEGSPYHRFEEIVRQFQRLVSVCCVHVYVFLWSLQNHKALEDYVTHIKVSYSVVFTHITHHTVLVH